MIDTSFTLSAYQWRGVWGERQTGTLQPGKGYCANLGHQEDETGLVYMRARYYEPTTGRFISEDPARDGVNWYLYADGNPVNRVDFSGRFPTLLAFMLSISLLNNLRNIEIDLKAPLPSLIARCLLGGDTMLLSYLIWQLGHGQPVDWRVGLALYALGFTSVLFAGGLGGGGGGRGANKIAIGLMMRELAVWITESDMQN